jgi:hypothetical protein
MSNANDEKSTTIQSNIYGKSINLKANENANLHMHQPVAIYSDSLIPSVRSHLVVVRPMLCNFIILQLRAHWNVKVYLKNNAIIRNLFRF